MPELPEVENIAQGLRNEIVSLTIEQLVVRKPIIIAGPYRRHWRRAAEKLQSATIKSVVRRAKRLIILTDPSFALVVQLGMTGKFAIAPTESPKPKHTHFFINLSDNKQLRFIDPRRFGRLWLLDVTNGTMEQSMLDAGMTRLGPEPADITLPAFRQILHSQRPIKSLLLDQTRIVGLGNIYVDESLFSAGIHPSQPAASLTPDQAAKLRRAVRSVLRRAIIAGGTTFSDFRNAYGEPGRFLKFLRVYQRTGQPCRKCRTPIARLVITGRSTHFCPHCQPK